MQPHFPDADVHLWLTIQLKWWIYGCI